MGARHARFHFLELGRHEPLGVGQGLLADPAQAFDVLADGIHTAGLALVVVGGLAALRRRDFEVVAEDLVVADASGAHARALAFTQFERGDPLARIAAQRSVLVELGRDAGFDDALFEHRGPVAQRGADVGDGLGDGTRPRLVEQRRQV